MCLLKKPLVFPDMRVQHYKVMKIKCQHQSRYMMKKRKPKETQAYNAISILK